MTIHTVVLVSSKRQGVAFGLDDWGHPIRIWLMTPRAVGKAMEKLEQLGRVCKSYAKVKPYDLVRVRQYRGEAPPKEWSLR